MVPMYYIGLDVHKRKISYSYYRPSDCVITYENREVVYSFGWEAPVVPRRIGIFMGTQLQVQKVFH